MTVAMMLGCFGQQPASIQLSKWPVERPNDCIKLVNEPQTQDELETLRLCINRDRPFGSRRWLMRTAKRLDLESAVRPRGRPRISAYGAPNPFY